MMDLDELQSVQSRERQTDSLQQLRESFYRDAGEYIAALREERERAAERADDPWNNPEVSRLSDDIETAEDTVEAIYERRVGKVVKMASLAAAGMPTDDAGLTDEERQLFDSLVADIEDNRDRVEAVLDGEPPGAADAESASPATPEPDPDAGSEDGTVTPGAADPDLHGAAADASEPDGARLAPPDAARTPADPGDSNASGVDAADLMGDSSAAAPAGDASAADADSSGPTHADSTGERTSNDEQSDGPADGQPREVSDGSGTDGDAVGSASGASGGADSGRADASGAAADEAGRTDSRPAPPDAPEPDHSDPPEPADDGSGEGDVDRSTVRITADVGEIFGVDQRSYDLSAADVVTLPEVNADPLVEKGVAERLD